MENKKKRAASQPILPRSVHSLRCFAYRMGHYRKLSIFVRTSRLITPELARRRLRPLATIGGLATAVTTSALGRRVVAHGRAGKATRRAGLSGRVVSGLTTILGCRGILYQHRTTALGLGKTYHHTEDSRSRGSQRLGHSEGCRVGQDQIPGSESCPCPTGYMLATWGECGYEYSSTHAALQRPSINIVSVHLADSQRGVLVSVHLDKSKATVRLEARLNNIAKVLEQGDNVVGGRVGRQVANIDGSLPVRRLSLNDVVATDTMGGELVVAKGGGGRQAHSLHRLLLSHGWLSLLVGPVATDGTRAEPLAVHGAQGLLSLGAVTEGNEPVATGAARLHVPHNTGLGNGAEGGESLGEDFIVDLIGKVTNENVKVARGIFLAVGVGLVGPVDTDFLYHVSRFLGYTLILFDLTYRLVNSASVQGLHGTLRRTRVIVLDETVVEALGL